MVGDWPWPILMLFMFVIAPFGLSHMFLSEKDKAELATKSPAYRGFISLCRTLTVLGMIFAAGLLVTQLVGRAGSGPDCEYGRTGRYCG